MRKPIAYNVLTPFGNRFRAAVSDIPRHIEGKLNVRTCDDGAIAVRSWWETRETFYTPIYRARKQEA